MGEIVCGCVWSSVKEEEGYLSNVKIRGGRINFIFAHILCFIDAKVSSLFSIQILKRPYRRSGTHPRGAF